MTDEQKIKLDKILNHYGFEKQSQMMIEESAELTQAICKLNRENHSRESEQHFIEELADVSIMIEQIKLALTQDGYILFLKIVDEKINRQIKRIEEE